MGPRTRWLLPRRTPSVMSMSIGALHGPVRPTMASAAGSDEAGNEVEDGIDDGVRDEDAEKREDDGARRRAADGGDATLDPEPFIGGDDADDRGEDQRL